MFLAIPVATVCNLKQLIKTQIKVANSQLASEIFKTSS